MFKRKICFSVLILIAVINISKARTNYPKKLSKFEGIKLEFHKTIINYDKEFDEKRQKSSEVNSEYLKKLSDAGKNIVLSVHQEIMDNQKTVNEGLRMSLINNINLNLTNCSEISRAIHRESNQVLSDVINCVLAQKNNFTILLENGKKNFDNIFENLEISKTSSKNCVNHNQTKKKATKCIKSLLKNLKQAKKDNDIIVKKENENLESNFEKIMNNLSSCLDLQKYQDIKKKYPNVLPEIRKCIDEEKKIMKI